MPASATRSRRTTTAASDFCTNYDQNCFDPDYDDLPIEDFIPLLEAVFARTPHYSA